MSYLHLCPICSKIISRSQVSKPTNQATQARLKIKPASITASRMVWQAQGWRQLADGGDLDCTLNQLRLISNQSQSQQQYIEDMRLRLAILLIAIASLASAGVLPDSTLKILANTPNPNDIFKQVSFAPLAFADPEVIVDIKDIDTGYHAIARIQFQTLYPLYQLYPINSCRYSALGLTRFYTFTITVGSASKDVTTAIQVDDSSKQTDSSPDEKDGFSEVSISWAQQDPEISFALNSVIKANWEIIQARPLYSCWARPLSGLWNYRFYFQNVAGRFEWSHNESSHSDDDAKKSESSYFTDVEPVFVVGESARYKSFNLDAFKKEACYPTIIAQLKDNLGAFDEKWILDISISVSQGVNYVKVTINFQPFLLKQKYEAQYYGSAQKAALLKIDETVFNGDGQSFEKWQEIKDFDSFSAFREAHQYALSQFTWLRFYKVGTAYSALHLKGRYVRLIYNGLAGFVDPKNQINIVIFIDECGRYFIDRNDFLATNLDSYGRNNWVSLFISTPDVTKAEFYQQIVKFYNAIYPKFWSANQLVDIKFKGDLHVVKFQNPTHLSVGVITVNNAKVQILNNFNWILLESNSPLIGRIENYVRGKYNVSSIMFMQYLSSDNGTHFEVGYLDGDKNFKTAYVLYIAANDVFTDENTQTFTPQSFANDLYINPLPKDVEGSLTVFVTRIDIDLIAVISFVTVSPRTFAIIAVSGGRKWQYIINWADQQWTLVSKQPYVDGFYRAKGVASASAASCTGFLRKLYPTKFITNFLYVHIETKSVGINLYTSLILNFGHSAFEAVVSTTFGVKSSHVLQKWAPILFVAPKADYGYGRDNNIYYGVDSSLFYDQPAKQVNLSVEPAEEVKPVVPATVDSPCVGRTKLLFGNCLPIF